MYTTIISAKLDTILGQGAQRVPSRGADHFPREMHCRPIDIIVPFYKHAQIAERLADSLVAVKAELASARCSLVAVNDSPDDDRLRAVLDRLRAGLDCTIPCCVIENERNLGFVRSANGGLRHALEYGHDAIVLNSDTVVFPGAVSELQRVSTLDPMIGFVSPRSNNATVCSLPGPAEYGKLGPLDAHAAYVQLSRRLPAFHFVPTGVGFCLLIKLEVLEDFGLFDESYGLGYNEENDLIMRANRCGYRAALANHAFVYHIGAASFSSLAADSQPDLRNAALLNRRYPEYLPGITRYFEGARYEAEHLLTGLLPDSSGRRDIVFDLTGCGAIRNCALAAARQMIICTAAQGRDLFQVHIRTSDETWRRLRLDEHPELLLTRPTTIRRFALAVGFAPPPDIEYVLHLARIAPLNVYAMFDPAAADCLNLAQRDQDPAWNAVFTHADAVLYANDSTADLFRRRFARRPGLPQLAINLPASLSAEVQNSDRGPNGYILVLGDALACEHVQTTAGALTEAFPGKRIVAVSLSDDDADSNDPSSVNRASFVVCPGFYESFCALVPEILARGKPVFARDTPANRQIRDSFPGSHNLTLYRSTADLIGRLAREGFPVWRQPVDSRQEVAWGAENRSAACLRDVFSQLIESATLEGVLLPRLEHARVLRCYAATAERDSALAEVVHLQQVLRDRERDASQLRAETGHLQKVLGNREREAAELRASLSWRLTEPLRRIGDLCFRLAGRT